jgi:hypothetical protein
MTCNFQEELSVASSMDELVLGWTSEGYTAQNERPRIEGELLPPFLALPPDNGNRFKMAEPELRNAEERKRDTRQD